MYLFISIVTLLYILYCYYVLHLIYLLFQIGSPCSFSLQLRKMSYSNSTAQTKKNAWELTGLLKSKKKANKLPNASNNMIIMLRLSLSPTHKKVNLKICEGHDTSILAVDWIIWYRYATQILPGPSSSTEMISTVEKTRKDQNFVP